MNPLRLVLQVAHAARRRGVLAILRTPNMTPGALNPPTVADLTLGSAVSVGATVLQLSASSAYGNFMPGDTLTVGATVFTVAAQVSANPVGAPQGFTNVPIAAATSACTAGATVTPGYAADRQVWCSINAYPQQEIDGRLITTKDLRVTMPVLDYLDVALPSPTPANLLVVNGDIRTIVSASPNYAGAVLVSWSIQAR